MKAALVLCCLALFVAVYAAYACDNDGDNKPDCTNATNQGKKIRNFWDPTRYWWCDSTVAVPVKCEIQNANGTVTPQLFLSSTAECVPVNQWAWSPNCPEN